MSKRRESFDPPSFDLDISQFQNTQPSNVHEHDEVNVGSDEIRFKRRNDPLKMKELRGKRKRKSSSDEQQDEVEEEQLVRRRRSGGGSEFHAKEVMDISVTVEADNQLPSSRVEVEGFEFVKTVPARPDDRMVSLATSSIAADLNDVLKDFLYGKFAQTCFGYLLNIPDSSHQGHIHRCIREHQIEHPYNDQFWICVNGEVLIFTLREFALITSLNCTGNEEQFDYTRKPPCTLLKRYFKSSLDTNSKITKGDVLKVFKAKKWGSAEDAIKLAILVFITDFIVSQTNSTVIPPKFFHLVDDDSYKDYSWGKVAFNALLKSYKLKIDPNKQCNRLYGMSHAMQV